MAEIDAFCLYPPDRKEGLYVEAIDPPGKVEEAFIKLHGYGKIPG